MLKFAHFINVLGICVPRI